MNKILYSILGIMIPFIGTSLGSSLVFFLNSKINNKIHKLMIGFAIGVMLSSSIFSLILPSIDMVNHYKWLPVSIGLICGFLFLIIINQITIKKENNNLNMLMFSVTLHNIPEGMAVGVCFAAYLLSKNIILIEAMLLSIGIAVQNIPEGAIISLPLKLEGKSKMKSFNYGMLSGIVEPISAFITLILLNIIVPSLPYLLSFAAGAMIYVVIEELVPEMHKDNKSIWGIIGVILGFILMMILDISL